MEQENHRSSILNDSIIYSATADGKIPWIATEDIAACAHQLLTQEDVPNDEYLILGPELLSYGDVSPIVSITPNCLIYILRNHANDWRASDRRNSL